MSTHEQTRRAHRIVDALKDSRILSSSDAGFLRSFLPELPIQKTLEEIAWDIHFAWCETVGNDWKEELFGNLETWLSELHAQLRAHLEGVKSEAHPEFLETEADYAAAPEGTIVACEDSPPCHKFGSEWSSVLFYGMKDNRGMSRTIRRVRRVLRWGWGE